MPRFKNDTTFIVPNIGFQMKSFTKEESRILIENKNKEDKRLKNKFLSVKAS